MEIFHKGSDPHPFWELWNRCYTFDGVCRRVYQMCSVVMDLVGPPPSPLTEDFHN